MRYVALGNAKYLESTYFLFERELSLLSRAPSSHWLIERARWGPLVSLWSLEDFSSNWRLFKQYSQTGFWYLVPKTWEPGGDTQSGCT